MSLRPAQRRSPPVFVWSLLIITVTMIAAIGFLGLLVWEQWNLIGTLQTDLTALQQSSQQQFVAMESTAQAVQERLATQEANDPVHQLAALQSAAEMARTPQQIAELRASLSEFQGRMTDLQGTLADVSARMELLESSGSETQVALPAEARLAVPRQRQSHNLSCESSAASMAANYLGEPLTEAEVLAALPQNENPHLGFRGNVDGPTGSIEDYGVYAGPIQDILVSRGLQAQRVGGGLAGIKAAIARGNPVIAWVTFDCQPGSPTTQVIDGQQVTLVPFQHVVVVTGFSSEGVWANDPWDGQEDFYAKADFERALSYFGDMAIEVSVP